MKLIIIVGLLATAVMADIFETKKAPAFSKDNCEAKCLGLCLTGKVSLGTGWYLPKLRKSSFQGASTLSIMPLSIMTLSIMTLSITLSTINIMTLSIMKLDIMTFSIMTLSFK
jgi:hypothetical protein